MCDYIINGDVTLFKLWKVFCSRSAVGGLECRLDCSMAGRWVECAPGCPVTVQPHMPYGWGDRDLRPVASDRCTATQPQF